jgi:hypothetical protein
MMIPLFATAAMAGQALEDAQAKRSKAFNDFYDRYKASGHTPEDATAISDQTIAPASTATSRALAQERTQALKGAGVRVMSQAEADAAHERMAKEAEEKEAAEAAENGEEGDKKTADGKPAGKGEPESSGAPGNSVGLQGPKKPAQPETVIDGKAIPKEITFSGSKKKK